jgi:transposase-like protein
MIQNFIDGKINRKEAARLTGLTERSVTRISKRISEKGLRGLKHGNRGKTPHNKTAKEFKLSVRALVMSRYFDFNLTHMLEKMRLEHGVILGYATLRRWCHEWRMVKNCHNRRRGKVVRKHRSRMPSEGLLLQMDGSPHRFNGKEEWCLVTAIDDATSDIAYGEFFPSETTMSCMKILQKIVELRGVPQAIYTDRAGWTGGQKRTDFSQFKRACDELGIELIFAYSPEAKGRIERAFRTIQDRLVPELRLKQIKDPSRATQFFNDEFLPLYWKKQCTIAARDLRPSFRPIPKDLNLSEVFCLKEYRCIKKNHQFSWSGIIWQLKSPIRYSIAGQNIEIRHYQDGTHKFFFADKPIEVAQAERQTSPKALLNFAA